MLSYTDPRQITELSANPICACYLHTPLLSSLSPFLSEGLGISVSLGTSMAISVAAVTVRPLNSDHSTSLSSSSSSKLSYLSSLQFPRRLRLIRIGNKGFSSCSRPRMLPLVEAKKQTFSSFDDLLAHSDKPVLVDFYATWCGPCQFMVPVLNEVSASMKDKIQVVKIDTEKYPSIADKYKIEALPTFIIFKDGEPYDRFEGALNANQLIERIESALQVKQ
ncbi:thioredoxin Y1, chloroplastic-like [Camellia sinensis]|uniref:thioredoxin Y1, chloroplastic-like n=1 Tax=Camellia sinensis TaxID=4442 RepID=UPI001035ECE2|nr:thioredoxin Y1, chloroplastic-like [Camellia sinensis]